MKKKVQKARDIIFFNHIDSAHKNQQHSFLPVIINKNIKRKQETISNNYKIYTVSQKLPKINTYNFMEKTVNVYIFVKQQVQI